jgi:hypothetical protein
LGSSSSFGNSVAVREKNTVFVAMDASQHKRQKSRLALATIDLTHVLKSEARNVTHLSPSSTFTMIVCCLFTSLSSLSRRDWLPCMRAFFLFCVSFCPLSFFYLFDSKCVY